MASSLHLGFLHGRRAAVACAAALVLGGWAGPAAAHGTFHERIALLQQRIERTPDDPRLWAERAELHRDHGDLEQALADLNRAAALEPALPALDFWRGRILLDAGRSREAVAALRRFLAGSPEHADAHATLARALEELGRPLDAASELARAIESRERPLPELYFDRARLLAEAGDERLGEAIDCLDAGIAALGPVASLELYAVDLEVRRGNADGALARIDRVAARSRRQESWLARRGEILEGAGRVEEARANYARALEEISALPSARRATPAARRLEGRVREALMRVSP
jgi:predicted Zn-dependent protease